MVFLPRRAVDGQRPARLPPVLHGLPRLPGPDRVGGRRRAPGTARRNGHEARRGTGALRRDRCARRSTSPGPCLAMVSSRAAPGRDSPAQLSHSPASTWTTPPWTNRHSGLAGQARSGTGGNFGAMGHDLPADGQPAGQRSVVGDGREGLPDRSAHAEQRRRHRLEPRPARFAARRASGLRAEQSRRRCAPRGGGRPGGLGESSFALGPGGRRRGRRRVVALPHYCAESVLPSGTLPDHIRPSQLVSSPIVNVHVRFDRRVTDLPFVAGLGTARNGYSTAQRRPAPAGPIPRGLDSAADNDVGVRLGHLGAQITEALRDLFPACDLKTRRC